MNEDEFIAPLDVLCPECAAPVGEHCEGKPHRLAFQHRGRRLASKERAKDVERAFIKSLTKGLAKPLVAEV
jgi:hypothetical protein